MCAAQAGRTAAYDGYLLFPAAPVRCDDYLRHEAGLGVEVLFGYEFLHGVNGYRLVYGAPGAGVLAAAVADAAADRGERIFTFYEFKCFTVFALRRFFQIALNGDMCGTGGFAW